MSELTELKEMILGLQQRVSALETIVRTKNHGTETHVMMSRFEEPLHKLVVLGREGENCLCGVQTKKGDKHIPIIELNMFNLEALIITAEEALRTGKDEIMLENYKQHSKHATLRKGLWQIMG